MRPHTVAIPYDAVRKGAGGYEAEDTAAVIYVCRNKEKREREREENVRLCVTETREG